MSVARAQPEQGNVPAVSFEYFPPKTAAQADQLDDTARRLAPFAPEFVSVTYGAAGSAQERSLAVVSRLIEGGAETAAHLTCAGASAAALTRTIEQFRAAGVTRFVALRGDPPGGPADRYEPHPGGFKDTADLVGALKRNGAAHVSVSAYPERHPASPDWETEVAVLKRKMDAGADAAITQFFYDNACFEAYVERVRRAGIDIPIVPGIMPVHNLTALTGFAARCGATIPASLSRQLAGLEADSEEFRACSGRLTMAQIAGLMRRGAESFHLYTLNRADLTEAVCRMLGVAETARAA